MSGWYHFFILLSFLLLILSFYSNGINVWDTLLHLQTVIFQITPLCIRFLICNFLDQMVWLLLYMFVTSSKALWDTGTISIKSSEDITEYLLPKTTDNCFTFSVIFFLSKLYLFLWLNKCFSPSFFNFLLPCAHLFLVICSRGLLFFSFYQLVDTI